MSDYSVRMVIARNFFDYWMVLELNAVKQGLQNGTLFRDASKTSKKVKQHTASGVVRVYRSSFN